VQSWDQIDLTAKVKTVRRKTRPWKSIIALLLAIAAAVISVQARAKLWVFHDEAVTEVVRHVIWTGTAVAFCAFGCMATYGLAGKARQLLERRVGASHAAIVRYALLLIGGFTTLVTTFELFGVPIGQLVLGGALTSVFVGIAAQQALSNVFAGLVLLFARPFLVGDEVRLRAGALGGQIEGVVTDIGVTYVRLHSGGSIVAIPNSQVLNAIVGPVPPKETDESTATTTAASSAPSATTTAPATTPPSPATTSPSAGGDPRPMKPSGEPPGAPQALWLTGEPEPVDDGCAQRGIFGEAMVQAPQLVVDSSQQRPASHQFRVEPSLAHQGVEPAPQAVRSARLPQPAPQQRSESEFGVAAYHLRIDHQPGFTPPCQHVLVMHVPVGEQSSGTRGERPGYFDRRVQAALGKWPPRSPPPGRQVRGQIQRPLLQSRNRTREPPGARWNRARGPLRWHRYGQAPQ